MFEGDKSYYRHRAEVELECAQRATVREAVKAHYQLAEAYLGKCGLTVPIQAETS